MLTCILRFIKCHSVLVFSKLKFTLTTSLETGSWQTLGSLPQPRYYLSDVSFFGRLIIAGGQTAEEQFPVLEYLWEERTWVQWEGYSTTRHKHVTVVMN